MALGWKGKPDSMNFPTSLFSDDILAGRSQLQETSKSLLATAILLASQHVFSSAAAGFLHGGGRLGQLTA